MIQNIISDLKYAVRAMRRAPLFTAIAVASLALGLGANTAIFSLLDQILLRPVAVQDPQDWSMLDSPGTNMGRIYGPTTCSRIRCTRTCATTTKRSADCWRALPLP